MAPSDPFIAFHVPENGNEGVVDAILHAHVQHQAIRSLRVSWVHVLAVLGGCMALTIVFPTAVPEWLNANLPMAWGLCCVGAVATGTREWVWSQRCSRLLAETENADDGKDREDRHD